MQFRRLAASYKPRHAGDADTMTFRGRLQACAGCKHRVQQRCAKAGRHVVVLARDRETSCPESRWPGEGDDYGSYGRTRREAAAGATSIAVVVPCHNYGRFLDEALQSVLNQSHAPFEILVVDDASTDQTAWVAGTYAAHGVRSLRVECRNPHAARRAGFANTTAEFLCFLDADDRLPPDYLKQGLAQFDAATGIVYSDLQCFGASTHRRRLDFDPALFPRRNSLHAGCLVRRAALEIAGAFDRDVPPEAHEDWAVWRPVVDAGWRVAKNPVAYEYRRHGASRCAVLRKERHGSDGYFKQAHLAAETVTLFIALSGRRSLWPRLKTFLERQTWPHRQTRLVLMDTSGDAAFGRDVRAWLAGCDYPDVRYVAERVGDPGLADADRRQVAVRRKVQLAAARIYNRAVRETTGEHLWVLEDDIVPPDDVCGRLLKHFSDDVASVAAPYPSRFHAGYVAWDRQGRTLRGGEGVQRVGGNGFGCVVLRRSVLQQTVLTHGVGTGDFDRNFYDWLGTYENGRLRALLDWSCECEHRSAGGFPCRFVVITTGRAGSTLLVESLDKHPDIRCYGEPLNPVYGYARTAETDGREVMERMLPADREIATGCKLGCWQPRPGYERWASAWGWLAERPDVRVIWLTRTDKLAWFASGKIAKLTKSWRIDSHDDPMAVPANRPRIRVDPDEFHHAVERTERRMDELRERLAGHPRLDVTYEELAEAWPETMDRVLLFLRVEPRELAQTTIRGERRAIEKVVENYREVAATEIR